MTDRRLLRLEELGSRVLPSAALPSPSAPAAALTGPPILLFSAHGHGGYVTDAVQSDAGALYRFRGTADLAGFGTVRISGWVHAVGFVTRSHAAGELTFTGPHGSVKLRLEGPEQAGFAAPPGRFSYQVVAATGAYQHLAGSGTLGLALAAQPAGHGLPPHGTFTLAT
jgi:hypothetical protein